MGEKELMIPVAAQGVSIDTYAGKVHIEWDPRQLLHHLASFPFSYHFSK
jgi:hypothetical protein